MTLLILILILTTLTLAACSPEQQSAANNVAAALGVQQAQVFTAASVEPVALTVEPSSSSSVAPPPCEPVSWRGNWYSCDMMVLLGPVE